MDYYEFIKWIYYKYWFSRFHKVLIGLKILNKVFLMSSLDRRDFLRKTGEALSFLTLINHFLPPIVQAKEEILERIKKNSPHILNLLKEMDSKGYRFLSVPWEDGEFLHLIVKAIHASKVLEIGTSHGFSAIWIGLSLEETNGHLITIEIDDERYRLALKNIERARLSHRITCLKGDAHKIISKIEGPFDFIFLDADKEGQMDYFNKVYPKKINPGGLLAVHNAISQAGAMMDYLEMIKKHPNFDTVILSLTMRDGFALSYRHRV